MTPCVPKLDAMDPFIPKATAVLRVYDLTLHIMQYCDILTVLQLGHVSSWARSVVNKVLKHQVRRPLQWHLGTQSMLLPTLSFTFWQEYHRFSDGVHINVAKLKCCGLCIFHTLGFGWRSRGGLYTPPRPPSGSVRNDMEFAWIHTDSEQKVEPNFTCVLASPVCVDPHGFWVKTTWTILSRN